MRGLVSLQEEETKAFSLRHMRTQQEGGHLPTIRWTSPKTRAC